MLVSSSDVLLQRYDTLPKVSCPHGWQRFFLFFSVVGSPSYLFPPSTGLVVESNFLFWIHRCKPRPQRITPHKIGVPRCICDRLCQANYANVSIHHANVNRCNKTTRNKNKCGNYVTYSSVLEKSLSK